LMPMWQRCIPKDLRLNPGFNEYYLFLLGFNQVFNLGIVFEQFVDVLNMRSGYFFTQKLVMDDLDKSIIDGNLKRVASIYWRNRGHFITVLDRPNAKSLFVNVQSGTGLTLVTEIDPRNDIGNLDFNDLDDNSKILEKSGLPDTPQYILAGRLYQKVGPGQVQGKIIPSDLFKSPQRWAALQYALKNWDNIGKRIAGLSRAQL
jgi:hypothetical protein